MKNVPHPCDDGCIYAIDVGMPEHRCHTCMIDKTEAFIAKALDPLAIIDKFEYSGDGYIKRYPDEKEYMAAMVVLHSKLRPKGVDEAFSIAFAGCNYGEEETSDAKYWFAQGFNAACALPND